MDLKNINSITLNDNIITSVSSIDEFKKHEGSDSVIPTIQVLKQIILQEIYPVGSIYMSQSDGRDPKEILGFGKWKKVENRYIYANTTPKEGGYDKIQTEMLPAHKHGLGLYTQGAGSHTHSITVHYSYNMDDDFGGGVWVPSNYNTGYNDHTVWSTSDPGNHSHYISGNTNNTATPTLNNLPAYQSFYVWYRTE